MAKDLTDVAVGSFFALTAMVGGVWRGVGHLHLCGTVLSVVEVEAITDVTEQPWRRLLLHRFLVMAAAKKKANLCATCFIFKLITIVLGGTKPSMQQCRMPLHNKVSRNLFLTWGTEHMQNDSLHYHNVSHSVQ